MECATTAEKKVCRLCIKNEGAVPIFQDDGHLRAVAIQIMAISNVNLSRSDTLPSYICNECLVMVHMCFNFKVQCEASDATLRATLVTTAPAGTQDSSTGANSAITALSNQVSEAHGKLGDTRGKLGDTRGKLGDARGKLGDARGKLDNLVALVGKAEEKTCCESSAKSPGKTVRFARTNTVVRGNSCAREPADIEVVDIADEGESPGSTTEQQQRSPVAFRGFSPNQSTSPRSGMTQMETSESPDTSNMMPFSNVPGCYRVELDSESEWEVNCNFSNKPSQI